MQCRRNGCSNDVTGKALYCSGACRTKASRVSVTPSVTDKLENVTVKASVTSEPIPSIDGNVMADKPTLAHYHARPDLYIPRREPDKLNWGPWMDSNELSKAGLKANRVTIPGDWDYKETV